MFPGLSVQRQGPNILYLATFKIWKKNYLKIRITTFKHTW